ncbi:MAG: hypothetical protein K8W52_32895 [Deltaproteobacteria bacterium]|nr:hypothetical protein [Deltaproteobacteria bacterium]
MTTRAARVALGIALSLVAACDRSAPARIDAAAPGAIGAVGAPVATAVDPRRAALRGELVYGVEAASGNQIWSIAAQGGAPRRRSPEGAAYFPTDAAAADGAIVAIAVDGDGDDHAEQLAIIARDGAVTRVGPRAQLVRNPSALGGDGGWIVETSAASFRDLYRVARDGTSARLTDTPLGDFQPAVSPDGGEVAFSSSRDGDAEIYAMAVGGGGLRRLTAFHRDDWGPRWAPDGQALAFLSDREGAPRVFVVARDGTGLVRVTPTGEDGVGGEDDAPVWSPDGKRIAYVVRRRGEEEVWVAARNAGGARRVSPVGAVAQAPAWSPDGNAIAYVSGAERRVIAVVNGEGGEPVEIVRGDRPMWALRWRD